MTGAKHRFLAVILSAAGLCAAGCEPQDQGATRVAVIAEGEPRLITSAGGESSTADQLLTASVAQGLVRFDARGQIVPGLAERWNVSDDGLSYIFRLASGKWPGGGKITAEQVARALKRTLASRSKNPLKDPLGAIADVVAMKIGR